MAVAMLDDIRTARGLPGLRRSAEAPTVALVAAVMGFFVVTLDAVVVNVALPAIGRNLAGGITGLQWVVDGYTLAFAALLLWTGALSDRIGARRAFAIGMAVFVAASVACGLAPTMGALIVSRFVQGSAAAVMMPSSMALLGQAYPDPTRRARAVAVWAMGGAAASSAGPLLGGVLALVSWRLIFFINLPVGAAALTLISRLGPSPHRRVPFDWAGQVSAIAFMGALTYGTIEAGAHGLGAPRVIAALGVAVVALTGFLAVEARAEHPMVPLGLFRSRNVTIPTAVGFAFVAGYYGLSFVMSLYLQQLRHLSSFRAGLAFLPMMLVGAALTPLSARLAERVGARALITGGMATMAVGLVCLSLVSSGTSVWALAILMGLVGLAGPLVMPPVTAVLLNSVSDHQAGVASGVFNTSRQIGGALAVAVFGALLGRPGNFMSGLHTSLLLAATAAIVAAVAGRRLRPPSGVQPAIR